MPEEQRPVAELAQQGIGAVRQRLREENARLAADGKPTMPEAAVLKMAEELIPRLRVADWLDRAEAAQRQLAHLDLRDLRSVVAASDDPVVARDESTRELATTLKAALVTKQDEELALWLADVEAALDVGRVVRALRLSSVPPKAGVPFPGALASRLAEATTASLQPGDGPDRWAAVLEAAAFSPVRAQVTPAAPPEQRSDELVATVRRLGPLLPQVAALFEIEVPAGAAVPKPLRPTPRRPEPRSRPPSPSASRGHARRSRPPRAPRRHRRLLASRGTPPPSLPSRRPPSRRSRRPTSRPRPCRRSRSRRTTCGRRPVETVPERWRSPSRRHCARRAAASRGRAVCEVVTYSRRRSRRDHHARPARRRATRSTATSPPGLEAAVDRLEADEDVWVGILTANTAGQERPVFCAGADLKAINAGNGAALGTERGGFAGFVYRERRKPIIAAVDGLATAGGCEIVLAADLVVATTRSAFGLAEAKRNLVAGAGGLFRLPRAVGQAAAMEAILTGEPIPAERAYALGLVSRLVEPGEALAEARRLADQITPVRAARRLGEPGRRARRRLRGRRDAEGDDRRGDDRGDASEDLGGSHGVHREASAGVEGSLSRARHRDQAGRDARPLVEVLRLPVAGQGVTLEVARRRTRRAASVASSSRASPNPS